MGTPNRPTSAKLETLASHCRLAFREYLTRKRLKPSRQRDIVSDVFFTAGGHLSVDELLLKVRRVDPKISQATIYRTMRLLCESGLAAEHHFHQGQAAGQARYELTGGGGTHHDHLICLRCNRIIEFMDERIESLQQQVAQEHEFVILSHRMELYGFCDACHRGQ